MKKQLSILTGAFVAFCLPMQTQAQDKPTPIAAKAAFASEVKWDDITKFKITNFQDQPLGRIQDVVLDLTNGRIVEVLIVSDQTLGLKGKTVAVPPRALISAFQNSDYQINMSTEAFAMAPAFDLSNLAASTQTDQVVAAYRYFGQVPNFLASGEAAGRTTSSGRPVESLGVVERMSKLLNMQVDNLKGVRLGRVVSLTLDLPSGSILNVYVETPTTDNMEILRSSQAVIPPTMFSFNEKHDKLLLDVSKVVYSQEPHVIFEDNADGRAMTAREQAYSGPHTNVALVQGTSFRDIDVTAQIYKSIHEGKFDPAERVEVGTIDGRVTLRGPVDNQVNKDSIGAIAIAIVRLDNVDNQIVVAPQSQASL